VGSALNPRQLARVLSFPSDTMHLHPDFGTLRDKVFDEVEDESFTTRFLRLALVEKFRSFIDIACNMVHPVPVPVPVTVTTPVTVI